MGDLAFKVMHREGQARTGTITLPHGKIPTPTFVPVATKGTVKALDSMDLEALGADILMCNTYHLMLKPGAGLVSKMGGLNRFMRWPRPLMTDSGGFQAFSLGYGIEHQIGKIAIFPGNRKPEKSDEPTLAKVTEKAVWFKSVYDDSTHRLTPEGSIRIQEALGADIMFVLDECTSPLADHTYVKGSLGRTHRWAQECLSAKKTNQALFGIVQGSHYKRLRLESAKFIGSLPFDGYGIGGSLGKSKKDMHRILEWVIPLLPEEKPRHLLGIGTVEDIFESVERGIDLFDCVGPTRLARVGMLYLRPESGGTKKNKFRFKVLSGAFKEDDRTIDPSCTCPVCRKYSRAYIRHLFKAKELLSYRLATIHNVHFFLELMREIRKSIRKGKFKQLKKQWMG